MVKILVAGDYAPQKRVAKLIDSGKYADVFGEVQAYTAQADYSIVNLETPVVDSGYAKPIEKCGPNLKCKANAIDAIKFAGFDMVTLANNHFYDYGEEGVYDTIQTCIQRGIDFIGGGQNIEQASKTFYKEINGVRFAFINCCENEFSIAQHSLGGANPINPIKQFYAIKDACKYADNVILIIHGGPERYEYPTPRMKELYRFFIDSGAVAVINHHQHRYSGYEFYHGCPIVYGLGNFCFDIENKSKTRWNLGYMVMLKFDESQIGCDCYPYLQCFEKPGVEFLDEFGKNEFEIDIKAINKVILDDAKLSFMYKEFSYSLANTYLVALEPYTNRLLQSAWFRRLLPSTLSKSRALNIFNYLTCESHLDRFKIILQHICK